MLNESTTKTGQLNITAIDIMKVSSVSSIAALDHLAAEEPLEIILAYSTQDGYMEKVIAITMRTPGYEAELAVGFLFTEGIIRNVDQIRSIECRSNDDNRILVRLNENEKPDLRFTDRNFYMTSSCGICGKASIEAIKCDPFIKKEILISLHRDLLFSLPAKLKAKQEVFNTTGGLHATALFDQDGELILLSEDVGRHNALDKLIGTALLNNISPSNYILLLSGRASFELIQKAAMAGINIVASVGAPSSLAVELAIEKEITLAGFLKGDRFNLYSHFKRILL